MGDWTLQTTQNLNFWLRFRSFSFNINWADRTDECVCMSDESSISLLMTDDGDYVMMAGEKQRRRDFRASLELPGKNLSFFRCHFVIISITP